MKRQPRARTGSGGYAPSMGDKDPRSRGGQPTVGEDVVRSRALQRLSGLPTTATQAQVLAALNDIVRTLRGEDTK